MRNCKKNIIHTPDEYIAQGFTPEEVPKITRHDILFNKWADGIVTDEEKTEMYNLIDELGL